MKIAGLIIFIGLIKLMYFNIISHILQINGVVNQNKRIIKN